MSGKRSRNKGAAGEREAAALMTEITGRDWVRGGASAQAAGARVPDIFPLDIACDVWIEVKRGALTNYRAALKQASRDCGDRAPIALTRDDRGDWIFHVPSTSISAFIELFEAKQQQGEEE